MLSLLSRNVCLCTTWSPSQCLLQPGEMKDTIWTFDIKLTQNVLEETKTNFSKTNQIQIQPHNKKTKKVDQNKMDSIQFLIRYLPNLNK